MTEIDFPTLTKLINMNSISPRGEGRCCRPSLTWALVCAFIFSLSFSTQAQNWYLPIDNSAFGEPAVNAATPPAGYFLAPDQACVQTVVDADPYCVNTDWDNLCQDAYNSCTYGPGLDWYLPNTVSAGPAVWADTAPADYYLANQNCAQIVINNDPYCVNSFWDSICQNAYCSCANTPGCIDPAACNFDPLACVDDGSCTYPQWYIPNDVDAANTPMVMVCAGDQPADYILADQVCAQARADADPFCVDTDWDSLCQNNYNDCLYGAGCDWYLPNTVSAGPAVWACAAPADYFLADQNCAQTVINNDPYCVNTSWDTLCSNAYCACANTPGCTDPAACNFDPTACTDDGSCILGYWYLPTDVGSGPAVFACSSPAGYYFADQACAQTVIDNDPFCLDNNWDNLCQSAYNDCLYGDGCSWYLPNTVGAGPAVWDCIAPTDYFFADQDCAQSVITDDPFCVQNNWDTLCQNAYCACADPGCTDPTACNFNPAACTDDGSCVYGYWQLPLNVGDGPAVFECDPPVGYYTADQACVQSVIDLDPFCVNNTWDWICQDAYNDCLYAVDGCDWYLPITVGGGPAVWDCVAPPDYFLANQNCAQSVITEDPFCVITNWDNLCQTAYCACAGTSGCTDPTACNYDPAACTDDGSCVYGYWHLPNSVGGGPAIFACDTPADYFFADQACAQSMIDNDPFCLDTNWDSICQTAYDCCVNDTFGCTDPSACNYDPLAICDDFSCTYPGCTYVNACNYNASAGCDDGSCLFLDACGNCGGSDTAGCTDPGADNYDPTASCDDGSCFIAGCTYPDATNYDSAATVDDGSCTFPAVNNCPEDLNQDGVVNAADLLQFLGAFGTICPQ